MGRDIVVDRERIKVQQVIAEENTTINVMRTIELPCKVRKIVDVVADIVELSAEILPNKVVVKGALHKQIFYIEEGEDVVKEFTVMREEFTDFVHMDGVRPGMDAMLNAQIADINVSAGQGGFPTKTVTQNAVLSINVKVVKLVQIDVVTDVRGPGITPIKERFSVEHVIGEDEKQVTVSQEVMLPRPARKIYDVDAVCRDLKTEIVDDRVFVKGVLHKQIFFVDTHHDTVHGATFDEEFSVVIEIPGARPGMDVFTRCKVEFCEANLIHEHKHHEHSMKVKQTCILQVFVKVTELKRLNIVIDVEGARAIKKRIRVENIIDRKCRQENVSATLEADQQVKKARNLHATLRNVKHEQIENKVVVKGTVHVQGYYIDCSLDHLLRETNANIPFTTFVHFDGVKRNTMVDVDTRIEYTDLKVDGEPCKTKNLRAIVIIEVCVRAFKLEDIEVVVDIEDRPRPPKPTARPTVCPPTLEPTVCPPSGFIDYTIQPGDTLFRIAMSFQDRIPGLTWQQILAANPGINPNNLRIGQVIRIPCVVGKG